MKKIIILGILSVFLPLFIVSASSASVNIPLNKSSSFSVKYDKSLLSYKKESDVYSFYDKTAKKNLQWRISFTNAASLNVDKTKGVNNIEIDGDEYGIIKKEILNKNTVYTLNGIIQGEKLYYIVENGNDGGSGVIVDLMYTAQHGNPKPFKSIIFNPKNISFK